MTMNEGPFSELPSALVEEILARTEDISGALLDSFNDIKENRPIWRMQLRDNNMLRKDADLPLVPIPTSCGIDGALAIERLLATDLLAVGAVAVEGLTPPSETRFWPEPRHLIYVDTEAHDPDTSSILRGIMIGMELQLAVSAPHDIVFLDGSLATPTIFFNQSLNKGGSSPNLKASAYLFKEVRTYLEAYKTILEARRSDRYWVAMPKYTTRREIGEYLDWPNSYDDRGLLSSILEAGEYTKPLELKEPKEPWHISTSTIPKGYRNEVSVLADSAIRLLSEIRIVYYRPYSWLPALRLELSQSIAETPARLSAALVGIKYQCGSAAILEPYPLYLADRMVKHLPKSVPAFRQVASQRISEIYEGDISEVLISLHGYRTESSR